MNLASLIPGARSCRPNPAKADILRLHGEGRKVSEIARITGVNPNVAAGVLRSAGLAIHRVRPPAPPRAPHDESLECYTRAMAYRLVGLGATDAEIAFETGVTADGAAAYRAACPANWNSRGFD